MGPNIAESEKSRISRNFNNPEDDLTTREQPTYLGTVDQVEANLTLLSKVKIDRFVPLTDFFLSPTGPCHRTGMKMISNFEKALNRNEFPKYFKGTGIYFTPDPDWDDQLHAINWSGLCSFLRTKKNPDTLLKNAFTNYILSIDGSEEDASNLLENIVCYYHMKKKIPVLSENNFDLVRDLEPEEKQIISESMKLFKKQISNVSDHQKLENYRSSINKLANDGGPQDIENL